MGSNEPEDYGEALFILRSARDCQQEELAQATGMAQSTISNLERGKTSASRGDLERLSAALRFAPEALQRTAVFMASLRADAAARERSPSIARSMGLFSTVAFDRCRELARAAEALLSAELRAAGADPGTDRLAVGEARRRAADLWARLVPYPALVRRALVLESREFQSEALCERVCAESETAAPDSAERALELAELALVIVALVEGDPASRARLEGYARAHLANALRVAGDLRGAEQELTRALRLWQAGAAGDPGVLDPVKLLDLAASLRKDQRKLGLALDLLDRGLATSSAPETTGRLLIKKASTLEKLGRNEEALAVLGQAAPLIEVGDNPRLVVVLRFGVAVNLCELGRHAEAEPLVGEVRAMAGRLDKELDLVRVAWLEARVAAGLGRTNEAVETLTYVQGEFARRRIAYDAALATLELAVLLLDDGRTTEVKRLAEQSKTIFDEQGVAREALATLQVFREAVAREALTAALARQLLESLRDVKRMEAGQ